MTTPTPEVEASPEPREQLGHDDCLVDILEGVERAQASGLMDPDGTDAELMERLDEHTIGYDEEARVGGVACKECSFLCDLRVESDGTLTVLHSTESGDCAQDRSVPDSLLDIS
jgi:hypothetical protein